MTPTEIDNLIDAVSARLRDNAPPTIQIVHDESPLGAHIQANAPGGTPTTIMIEPNAAGAYEIKGVRSFNKPGEIEILRVSIGDMGHGFNAASFDSASYAMEYVTDDDPELDKVRGYYATPSWGKITRTRPLYVTFAAMGYPAEIPSLNWTLFGRYTDEIQTARVPTPTEIDQAVRDELARRASSEIHEGSEPVASTAAPQTKPAIRQPWGIPRDRLGTMIRRR